MKTISDTQSEASLLQEEISPYIISTSDPAVPPPETMDELKCWLLVRAFDPMPWPKMMAQAGHGFVGCLEAANLRGDHWVRRVQTYLAGNQPRIVVKADGGTGLYEALRACTKMDDPIPSHLVLDEGRTIFPEPTYTVLAIGPCYKRELPSSIRRLRLL